ncbi:MAG: sulfatase, partial [Verrucomicrobiota bacterium]
MKLPLLPVSVLPLLLTALLSADDSRPNIIFLLTDDQSFSSLGCYGNPDVQTPHLDQLAADGVRFDRHYNTTAICMASRASILTGLYEYRAGCNFNLGDLPAEHWADSYPMILRENGYRTAIAGKIGIEVEGVGLPSSDFDAWGAGPGQTSFETKKNKSIAHYADTHPHATLAYAAFAHDFIEESVAADAPFCLSISFKAPHRPVTPDPQFDSVYEGKTFQKPKNYGREAGTHFAPQSRSGRQYERFESWGYADDFDAVMAKYHQQIYAVDVAVGRIRESLQKAGIAENTVIVFTSDNGFLCGSHGYGSKVLPYEESSRVPLIIHDPRNPQSAGTVSDALTGNIDLAPTLLAVAGLPSPENRDGTSLLPLVTDPSSSVRSRLALMNFWGPTETHSFSIVTSTWKYNYWFYAEKDEPFEELFDLRGDRYEMVNEAQNPERSPLLNEIRGLYDEQIAAIA